MNARMNRNIRHGRGRFLGMDVLILHTAVTAYSMDAVTASIVAKRLGRIRHKEVDGHG
jgi:hypothetical protein